jgi:hypothetical protein
MPQHMNGHMKECVNYCQDTQEACLEAVTYCLERGRDYADPDCVALLITCEAVCGASVKSMLVGSEHHTKVCKACAEICEAVIADFEEFDDRPLRHLVDVAKRSAESCRQMSRMRVSPGVFRRTQPAYRQHVY